MNINDRKFQKRIELFKEDLETAFGDTIRKPIPARLGTVDENGSYIVKVPDDIADEPNEYYFSEAGSTSFRGKAQLGSGAIQSEYLRYGTPIRVIRDVLTGTYEIIGIDTKFFEQYYRDVAIEDVQLFNYNQLAPSLIRATNPVSMQVVVLPASFNNGEDWKYLSIPLFSVNWSQAPYNANVPGTAGLQRFVLLYIKFSDMSLNYVYGDTHPVTYSFIDALNVDADNNDNALIPLPDGLVTQFRLGYIRLYNGQTAIQDATDIIPMQDFLSSGASGLNLDDVVTAAGDVGTIDGNVLIATGASQGTSTVENANTGNTALPTGSLGDSLTFNGTSYVVLKHNITAIVAPTTSDDSVAGYRQTSIWFDTALNDIYMCIDPTAGAAVWVQIGG